MGDALKQLRERLAEVSDLRQAAHLLEWDQQTMMPPRGVNARAETLATLGRISHEWFVDDETGRRLDAAAREVNGQDPDSDDARLIAVVQRRWEKARRVPAELASELARAASIGQMVWVDARARSDFDAFAPYLERNFELAKRYVECLPEFQAPYDALLDDYEPGMRSAEVSRIFGELKSELLPLIAAISQTGGGDDSHLYGEFPVERQRPLVAEVLGLMGFEHERWRLDEAAHPFATSFGRDDVRLTTRWDL